jgi:hypothetical protein
MVPTNISQACYNCIIDKYYRLLNRQKNVGLHCCTVTCENDTP